MIKNKLTQEALNLGVNLHERWMDGKLKGFGEKLILVNHNLSGLSFNDPRSFNNRILTEAVFSESDLSSTNMCGIALNHATVIDVLFIEANLSSMYAVDSDFTGSNFYGATLPLTNFSNTKLLGANFNNSFLINTCFVGADLTNADFTGAYLLHVNFTGANLAGAKFGNNFMRNVTWPEGYVVGELN